MKLGVWMGLALGIATFGCSSEGKPEISSEVGTAAFAIRDVRVFDGVDVIPRATVVVGLDGTIEAVGPDLEVAPELVVVDGTGRTLLPGLIDAHSHVWSTADLTQALAFGVTTELDMLGDPSFVVREHEAQSRGDAYGRADLFGAGNCVTAPGGHGTEYGIPVPTLGADDDPREYVETRLAEGSDFIKIVHEDGSLYGFPFPTLTFPQIAGAARAARDLGVLSVVHVSNREGARFAAEGGASGLAHLWGDGPDDALAREIAAKDMFVIATLSVLRSDCDGTRAERIMADSALAPYLSSFSKRSLMERFPTDPEHGANCEGLAPSIADLVEHGVPVLAGTDAANPGTAHGASLHDELVLLVDAGLSEIEALAAATSRTAERFHMSDRGRIAAGLRADLLLVDGDPTTEISDTRRIAYAWKGGVLFDRDAYRLSLED